MRRFVESGLADELGGLTGAERRVALTRAARGEFATRRVLAHSPGRLAAIVDRFRSLLAERVVLPSGRVLAGLTGPAASSAFLAAAEDAVLEAAFAVAHVGYRLVAVTPTELVIETNGHAPEVGEAIGACVSAAIARSLDGLATRTDILPAELW